MPNYNRNGHDCPKRSERLDCHSQPIGTQPRAWHEPDSPPTGAYDQYRLLAWVNSTVQDVVIKDKMPFETL
jgi:hypothetical protein